ncbi:glycosyltransferase [Neobacillus vireti]|uniref:glycosyltransferase n=1 Tax=Neobacillus vireti TaxID=220686 RepID=UPI002FFF04DC
MKKHLLFVMNNLNCGGAEKSLISILEAIDYTRYNVDLFLFKHEGIFMNKVPRAVNILPEPKNYKYFDMPLKGALKELIAKRKFINALYRIFLGYLTKTEKNGSIVEQKFWKFLSKSVDNINDTYDVAIGFLEKNPIYFCIDKVNAKKKIGWIHTDYNKLGVNLSTDENYYKHLDYVVTVSEDLVESLKNLFPDLREDIKCIHNLVSEKVIKKLSFEDVSFRNPNDNSISLISLGRLVKEKGLDIALEAFDILIKRGHRLKWYLIGEGYLREELEKGIKAKNLEGKVILLGLKANPYPYLKQSDIFIQTSRVEGKSIAIDEAKILAKPILITNFDTANNHILNGINGVISNMDPISVANELEKLILEKELRTKLMRNLKEESLGRENEINKLYQLIDN